MSPDELQRVFAAFMALQKKLGHEGPALRDAALQFGRGLSQTLTVFHKHLASQFPPGTDLSQVRLGWVIPPPGERTAAPPDPGDNSSDEAMQAEGAAAAATPQPNPESKPICNMADAEAAHLAWVEENRAATGYAARWEEDWTWAKNQPGPFRITQPLLRGFRAKHLTEEEHQPGPRRNRKSNC
jgi:hypothetical protein